MTERYEVNTYSKSKHDWVFDHEIKRYVTHAELHALLNNNTCDHSHYSFQEHGRVCTCGTMMTDFGD